MCSDSVADCCENERIIAIRRDRGKERNNKSREKDGRRGKEAEQCCERNRLKKKSKVSATSRQQKSARSQLTCLCRRSRTAIWTSAEEIIRHIKSKLELFEAEPMASRIVADSVE